MLQLGGQEAQPSHRGGQIELNDLIPTWKSRLTSPYWGAWRCSQTKQTLQQVEAGVADSGLGGMSNAMSVRSAAAIAAFDDEDGAAKAARTMMFTHRHEESLAGGEFFTRVAFKVAVDGATPREAIDATASQMGGCMDRGAGGEGRPQVRGGDCLTRRARCTRRSLRTTWR